MNVSEDTIQHQAYLVSRGVRPLAIVDAVKSDDPVAVLKAYNKMQFTLLGLGPGSDRSVVPFAVKRKEQDVVDVGFAARAWIANTLKWVLWNAPQPHLDRLVGLLLGYSPDAIASNDEADGGRLFPDTITALGELESRRRHDLPSGKEETCHLCSKQSPSGEHTETDKYQTVDISDQCSA